jgi:hypothetical protein
MLAEPGNEVATRIVTHVRADGRLAGFNIPIEQLDPNGLVAWTETELQDHALAEALRAGDRDPLALLLERRRQSIGVLEELGGDGL